MPPLCSLFKTGKYFRFVELGDDNADPNGRPKVNTEDLSVSLLKKSLHTFL